MGNSYFFVPRLYAKPIIIELIIDLLFVSCCSSDGFMIFHSFFFIRILRLKIAKEQWKFKNKQ